MATFNFSDLRRYPEGTTVEAHALDTWPNSDPDTDAAPPGTETDSAVVTDGVASLTLSEGEIYMVYALVASEHVYTTVHVPQREGVDELGYAERLTNDSSTSTTLADITGLAVTVLTRGKPIEVEFEAGHVNQLTANAGYKFAILEDGVIVTRALANLHPALYSWGPVRRKVRLLPTPGSHTYKVQFACSAAGTLTLGASDPVAGAYGPMYIHVRELEA
jgi:hypothetical protein